MAGLGSIGVIAALSSATPAETRAVVSSGSSQAAACPLTAPQEMKSVQAFEAMMPVFRHPRCTNCHGGVNPFVPFAQGGHRGGAMNPADSTACEDCHGELPGWRVPRPVLHFTTKTDRELCIFFKRLMPEGPGIFIEHIEFEPRVPPFILQAFKGDRALNTLGEVTLEDLGLPFRREPPPGTHAGLVRMANEWGRAIGRGWVGFSPECGCEIRHAWFGTVTAHAVFEGAGMPGTLTVTSSATVLLERIPTPSYASGTGVQVYRATGGTVRWDALASGGCRGNAGGTMPLDTLDIDGNPMVELRLEDVGNGRTSYQPTTGSWPDRWSPLFDLRCIMAGTTMTVPMTNLLPTWWHYDIPSPPTTADPDRLQGRYEWIPGPGSRVIWEWDLSRRP